MALDEVLDGDPYVSSHPQGRPFWQAAADGVFLLPRCRACGQFHWYPRPFCPHCGSEDVAWQRASGLGTLYAFSALRRVAQANIVAYVILAEGPVMLTNLVGCRMDELAIGIRVSVMFQATKEGRFVPVFRPAAPSLAGAQ